MLPRKNYAAWRSADMKWRHCIYRKYTIVVPVLISLFSGYSFAAGDRESFKPGEDWRDTDGEIIDCHAGNIIHVAEKGMFYWFGEHRGNPRGVACYSSTDLYNWENRGVALNTGATEGLQGGFIERPKVAYNKTTKKFVMWFHYETSGYGLAHQGVAVCDSAPGPYTFIDHFRPNDNQSRDMGMFTDEDGTTYIGYAANRGTSINADIRMVELSEDYLSVTENDVVTTAHCEGPAVMKWNDTYYLLTSQCQGWTPNPATYYTCDQVAGVYRKGFGDDRTGDPCIGDVEKTTFNSQPSLIVKVPGYSNGFIYIGDRWNGVGSTRSQYVFLPVFINDEGKMELKWYDEWSLDLFTPVKVYKKEQFTVKKMIYDNALNNGTMHGYDLLGRVVEDLRLRERLYGSTRFYYDMSGKNRSQGVYLLPY